MARYETTVTAALLLTESAAPPNESVASGDGIDDVPSNRKACPATPRSNLDACMTRTLPALSFLLEQPSISIDKVKRGLRYPFHPRALIAIVGGLMVPAALSAEQASVSPPSPIDDAVSRDDQEEPATDKDIVITGRRVPSSAVGDVYPIAVLDQDAIRSIGATSIKALKRYSSILHCTVALQIFIASGAYGQVTYNLPIKSKVNTHLTSDRDGCDGSSESEVVVCGRRSAEAKYRIPKSLRDEASAPAVNDLQIRLGPSYTCNNAGSVPCTKASIPIFSIKNGKTQIGPFKSK